MKSGRGLGVALCLMGLLQHKRKKLLVLILFDRLIRFFVNSNR